MQVNCLVSGTKNLMSWLGLVSTVNSQLSRYNKSNSRKGRLKFKPLESETRFLFLKILKFIFNIHCTCIHICPIPILHVFVFQHSFPSFCKIVIIHDQAHSTGSAGHFVSFKQLKRQDSWWNSCTLLQVLLSCWEWQGTEPAGLLCGQLSSTALLPGPGTALPHCLWTGPCCTTRVRLSPHGCSVHSHLCTKPTA